LVTNSKYTAKLLYERAKKTADVLYPPVRLINCKDDGKDNVVVSLGRIVRDKKYEDVIYAAEALKDTKFIIVGRVQDEKYYEELRRRSPSNVSFATNASEEEKQQVLCKAKVILHPKREEPFGIAIVEGMSAGAIPTVYKNGGAWFDIVSEGRFGYGYERIEELPELIKQALSDDKLRKEVKERATMFSDKNFMENFLKITGL
jgi:glycosyltransferase involved in cell wall biosynthesis